MVAPKRLELYTSTAHTHIYIIEWPKTNIRYLYTWSVRGPHVLCNVARRIVAIRRIFHLFILHSVYQDEEKCAAHFFGPCEMKWKMTFVNRQHTRRAISFSADNTVGGCQINLICSLSCAKRPCVMHFH